MNYTNIELEYIKHFLHEKIGVIVDNVSPVKIPGEEGVTYDGLRLTWSGETVSYFDIKNSDATKLLENEKHGPRGQEFQAGD